MSLKSVLSGDKPAKTKKSKSPAPAASVVPAKTPQALSLLKADKG